MNRVLPSPFCAYTNDTSVNLLVVGQNSLTEPLTVALRQANNTHKIIAKYKTFKCESVTQILKLDTKGYHHVNYIAFCVNSYQAAKLLRKVEDDLNNLNKTFLLGRICLLVGLGGSFSERDSDAIKGFKFKYQVHQLNGKIHDKDSCLDLASRLLRLVAYACSIPTGYPVLEYCKGTSDTSVAYMNNDVTSDTSTETIGV